MSTLPLVHPSRLTKWKGQDWISTYDLQRAGYFQPAEFDIIRVQIFGNQPDRFFELSSRTASYGDGWWLTLIDPEQEFKDLPLTTDTDGKVSA